MKGTSAKKRGSARRIACVCARSFAVSVLRSKDPELAGVPLVVLGDGMERSLAVEVSPEARVRGVRRGLRAAQVRALCPEAVVLPRDTDLLARTGAEVARALLAVSPVVDDERAAEGLFFLDVRGLARLHDGEEGILRRAVEVMAFCGHEAGAGLADHRFPAFAAALVCREPRVVERGKDRAFLAPLPLSVLPLPSEMAGSLLALGVTKVGELAALPAPEIERRFGAVGVCLHRIARGMDDGLVSSLTTGEDPGERIESGAPVHRYDELRELLRQGLEKMVARTGGRAQGFTALEVVLELDDASERGLVLRPGRPLARADLLLSLLELVMKEEREREGETWLSAPIVAVRLRGTGEAPLENAQGLLFQARAREAERFAAVLFRLRKRLGEEAVGAPGLRDDWRCEERFRMDSGPDLRALVVTEQETDRHARVVPASVTRMIRPPYLLRGGRGEKAPGTFTWGGARHVVIECRGPFRLSGRWWDGPFERDEHDLVTEEGGVFRAYHDRRDGKWYLVGVVD
jgi:protein ImuB